MLRRLLLPILLLLPGCATRLALPNQSPLHAPSLVKNGVILDVLFVRYSPDDREFYDAVWQEADELRIATETRRRLEANGFRVGVLGGPLPLALENRLQLTSTITTTTSAAPAAAPDAKTKPVAAVDPDKKPTTRQRQLRLGAGRRANVLVLGELERRPELSMLMRTDDGRVEGRTFHDVQGLFATRAFPQGDGTVRLELTPELEHGRPQKRFIPGDGMFQVEFGPPREVLEKLRCAAQLSPGQLLVLAADPKRPGSLGHQFFTEGEVEAKEHKLLLIRLSHTEYDDRFSTSPINSPDAAQP